MPQVSAPFLLVGLAWLVASALAPRRAWPWLRDLLSVALLWWWEPRTLAMLGLLAVSGWLASRARRRLPALSWLFLGIVAAAFIAVRLAQRGQGADVVLVPVGFGFAVLRIVHWWVEQGRGTLPRHGLRDLWGWLIYLPTVFVGPVQRFEHWLRWERRRRFDARDAARGLHRILLGYVRIVVFAFWLVGSVLPRHLLWLPPGLAGALTATATLYLVFAGASDIAIGMGLIAGQRVPENFSSPFMRSSLPDFWRSWHMTVTEWCRVYVYVPLLARTRSTLLSAGVAMASFAAWHELSVAYLAWGSLQALGLLAWYRVAPRPAPRGLHWRIGGWLLTTSFIVASFWMLRAWPRGGQWYAR